MKLVKWGNGVLSFKRVKDSPIGKEADTYKVSTTANSTSTMHKLTSKPITLDCFEIDDYKDNLEIYADAKPFCYTLVKDVTEEIIDFCEELRKKYLETKDERYWKELIRWLPESWLQTRTWTCSYETLYSIYHQRKNHRLNEWSGIHTFGTESFIGWIELLPYAKDLLLI